jgi:hypothetical protein
MGLRVGSGKWRTGLHSPWDERAHFVRVRGDGGQWWELGGMPGSGSPESEILVFRE